MLALFLNMLFAVPAEAACVKKLGQDQIGGGLTCHHTYDKQTALEAGFGGCDVHMTSIGGIGDMELIFQFAKSKGFLVKGGGNCFDLEEITYRGKKVTAMVLDNGSGHDVSRKVYEILTGVTPGPNCEDAVCPIGNFQKKVKGNARKEFMQFAHTIKGYKFTQ